jgi:hypothetical protein
VPNAFDVVLLKHVGFVIVCSASYRHPTINNDGLINIKVVVHDICVTNMLLNLESLDTSPIEKLSKKKGVKMGNQSRVSR